MKTTETKPTMLTGKDLEHAWRLLSHKGFNAVDFTYRGSRVKSYMGFFHQFRNKYTGRYQLITEAA